MYTKKRIFTKNDVNLNYNDYNKLKNGVEILKTIKSEDNLAILKQFNNYNNWQTLSSAYFPFIDNNSVEVTFVKNLFSANESYTCKEEMADNTNMCNNNVLYPYGKIISKKSINPQFPTNIYLHKWCNSNKSKLNEEIYDDCNPSSSSHNSSTPCDCKKKIKKCNLCKNARALFI
jgi:hypothetical protein